jgi:hypothetical protein
MIKRFHNLIVKISEETKLALICYLDFLAADVVGLM